MLEVLFLIALCRLIGEVANDRKRNRLPRQLLLVALWLAGEFVGAALGAVVLSGAGVRLPSMVFVYLCAIVVAILGAVLAFTIARNLTLPGGEGYTERHYGDRWASALPVEGAGRPATAYPEGITDQRPPHCSVVTGGARQAQPRVRRRGASSLPSSLQLSPSPSA